MRKQETGLAEGFIEAVLRLVWGFRIEIVLAGGIVGIGSAARNQLDSLVGVVLPAGLVAVVLAVPRLRGLLGRVLSRARVRRQWHRGVRLARIPAFEERLPVVVRIDHLPAGERLDLRVPLGSSVADLEGAAEVVAAALGVRDVRVRRDPANAARAEVVIVAAVMRTEYRPMVWLGAVIGLRWGEVAGLRVGRVDLLRRTISVAEQVSRGMGGVGFVSSPKSSAGRRTLTIPAPLIEVLSAHLAARDLTAADADALLFPNRDGTPLDYSNWRRRVWLPATATAGLSGLGFHDLRRANATAMVLDGIDVKTAQARLGHSDPRLTLAIYAQATQEGDRRAADRLGSRFMSGSESAESAKTIRGMDAG